MILPINYENASPNQRRAVREEYAKLQNGLCWFCKFPLSQETPNPVKQKYPLELRYTENSLVASRSTGNKTDRRVEPKTREKRIRYDSATFPRQANETACGRTL